MADARVSVPRETWTKLIDNATGDVSIALLTTATVYIQATAADSAPSDEDGMPLFSAGDGWSEATILEKFPGVATAAYLWAFAPNNDVQFYVSYA